MKNIFNTKDISCRIGARFGEECFHFEMKKESEWICFGDDQVFDSIKYFGLCFDSELNNLKLYTKIKQNHIDKFKSELIAMIPDKFKSE